MKTTRTSCLAVLILTVWFLFSPCLPVLFGVPLAYAQETQTFLKPNQLITFSLAPGQEKLFVLQMKKGDFAEIQSLARQGLNLSFEIYDSARRELFVKSEGGDGSIWFVAPTDGDFMLVSKLAKYQDPEISDAQKITIQYINKFKLPRGTNLKGLRKVNGFDVRIMTTPDPAEGGRGDSILIIEKNGRLQYVMKGQEAGAHGFSFVDNDSSELSELTRDLKTTRDKGSRTSIIEQLKKIQLVNSTPDKTGNGIPDIMLDYFSGGAHCCFTTYFFDLGDTVKLSESINSLHSEGMGIGKNAKGGLVFSLADWSFAYWLTSFAQSPAPTVILEFRNGKLRPNLDQMKAPPPSLAVLRSKAQISRNQLSLKPYKGADNEDSVLYGEDSDYEFVFWGIMLELIYTGNEELAWQFLDLVWPPQKQGKEIFIRDFKNQLLESPYWQMISEDRRNNSN